MQPSNHQPYIFIVSSILSKRLKVMEKSYSLKLFLLVFIHIILVGNHQPEWTESIEMCFVVEALSCQMFIYIVELVVSFLQLAYEQNASRLLHVSSSHNLW